MEAINNEELKRRRKESIKELKKKRMKAMAIKQMKLAHFKADIIKDFENNNTIYVSHLGNDLTKATDIEMRLIKDLENYENIKIYHLEQRNTERRKFLHYFYINDRLQNKIMTSIRNL